MTERGVTLIELMIVLVIGAVILGAVYATFIAQQRSFTTQDHVTEMNSTSKIALDKIVNDIRDAGFGVPDNVVSVERVPGCAGINGSVQKINVKDNTSSEDEITLLGGYRQAGNLSTPVSTGAVQITLKNYDGDTLNTNDKSYISIGGLSFALVTEISGSRVTLNTATPVDRPYPAGIPVYLIENVKYRVVSGQLQRVARPDLSSDGKKCSTHSDSDIVAENVEDLQFETVSAGRIRVNILARAARPDRDFEGQGNSSAFMVGNREHAATNDAFRRRWRQMDVSMRNPL